MNIRFSGASPAQASVAPEESHVGLQKFSKKDSALFDGSGTSASVQKDPANSESEYTPKSDTSSGVSSGGSSSVVTLGSNDSLFFGATALEGPDKLLPVLNFHTGEIEYKPEPDNELYDVDKFKMKMLHRNCSANGTGEPLLNSVVSEKVDSTKDNSVLLEMQKNSKAPDRSDTGNFNGSASKIKPVFVRLNRLSEKDQALMQKSLTEFAQQQPSLANKLGITAQNHRKTKPSIIESDSEEDQKSVSRIFKSRDRDKAREAKKKQGMLAQRFCLVLNKGFRYQIG